MSVQQAPGSVPTHARDQSVTQLRIAEQQLAEAEAKYRALVENAVEGIFRTTPDGRFLMANRALARTHGLPDKTYCPQRPEEAIAQPSTSPRDKPRTGSASSPSGIGHGRS